MTNNPKCDNVRIDTLTKAQLNFLNYCKELGWGKVEVVIKGGEPVLATKKEEYLKFD